MAPLRPIQTREGLRPSQERRSAFQHFYPYFDVIDVDWEASLRAGIEEASGATDRGQYVAVLEQLVAPLDDGHIYVHDPRAAVQLALPIGCEWIDDAAVVVALADPVDPASGTST